MKRLHYIAMVCLFGISVGLQLGAEEADGKVKELSAPHLLGFGVEEGSLFAPHAHTINPAAAASVQRVTFDGSYVGILDASEKKSELDGHAVNFSAMIPSKVGVFTGAGHFLTASDISTFAPGTQISGYGSFSKDVYEDLYVGAGLRLSFADKSTLAAAADLGMIRREGELYFLDDARWGVSLLDLGYSSIEGDRRAPFTPMGGIEGVWAQTDLLESRIKTSLSFPSFQNVRMNIGVDLSIGDSFNIGISSRMNLKSMLGGEFGELIPSLGLSYTLRPGGAESSDEKEGEASPFSTNELRPALYGAPMSGSVWAFGAGLTMPIGVIDQQAPEIELDLSGYGDSNGAAETEETEETEDSEDSEETTDKGKTSAEGRISKIPFTKAVKDTKVLKEEKRTYRIENSQKQSKSTPEKENPEKDTAEKDSPEEDSSTEKDGEEVEYQETLPPDAFVYISPDNDGIQDVLEFPLKISERRYLKEYEFVITDMDGKVVRRIENKEKRPEIRNISTFFKNLFAPKEGVEVPEKLRWDGTTEGGTLAEDGLYRFFVRATDDNGNTSTTDPYTVYLDTSPPKVFIDKGRSEERVFSPNDDGNKDTLPIEQKGSKERLWEGQIKNNAGQVVRNFEWRSEKPKSFSWDGTNDEDILVPDGVYEYSIEATDRAGNTGSAEYKSIVKNTEETPIGLKINRSHFSPEASKGRKDTITLTPDVPVTTGIERWSVEIVNENGTVQREYAEKASSPGETVEMAETLVFEGRDDDGEPLPEGTYSAKLEVLYVNGNNPKAQSPSFVLDNTAPKVSLNIALENVPDGKSGRSTGIFSPNGDGKLDSIDFNQETSTEEVWYGRIYRKEIREGDEVETTLRKYKWIEKAPARLTWNGREEEGGLADDSENYFYRLYAEDKAGNRNYSQVSFELNTEEAEVFLTVDKNAFSPNGDGVKDVITFLPKLKKEIERPDYTLSVYPAAEYDNGTEGKEADADTVSSSSEPTDEQAIYTIEENNAESIPDRIDWNGRDNEGQIVPDGTYRIVFTVTTQAKATDTASAGPFTVDTQAPQVAIEEEYGIFSPNGDGNKDTVQIRQEGSSESLWQGSIVDEEGNTIETSFWKGKPGNFTWDGTDDAGNVVEDGTYTYTVVAEDDAGNRTEKSSDPIELDTRLTKIFVTADTEYLSPNGDGMYETIGFNFVVNRKEGVESWYLDLVDETGEVQRRFKGKRIPEKIRWNGTSPHGENLEGEDLVVENEKEADLEIIEGRYTARFGVRYNNGNRPTAKSLPFVLDTSAPQANVSLKPTPFSPDNDGVDDELTIGLDVEDFSAIEKWSFNIYDPNSEKTEDGSGKERPLFKKFSGEDRPAEEIVWDGRGEEGELVYSAMDYPYEFTVTDVLGNSRTVSGEIPVDVLVVREGDILKIKIASINFEPNKAEFLEDDPEIAQRNQYVLDRVAEILKKYRQYQVTIEGHAVKTKWWDEDLAEKEQKEELIPLSRDRAGRVKQALIERGVPANGLETKGVGGDDPIVPHENIEDRWKNRRVEFILEKE